VSPLGCPLLPKAVTRRDVMTHPVRRLVMVRRSLLVATAIGVLMLTSVPFASAATRPAPAAPSAVSIASSGSGILIVGGLVDSVVGIATGTLSASAAPHAPLPARSRRAARQSWAATRDALGASHSGNIDASRHIFLKQRAEISCLGSPELSDNSSAPPEETHEPPSSPPNLQRVARRHTLAIAIGLLSGAAAAQASNCVISASPNVGSHSGRDAPTARRRRRPRPPRRDRSVPAWSGCRRNMTRSPEDAERQLVAREHVRKTWRRRRQVGWRRHAPRL
ncbi:MAG: hypothetical protein QOF69_758, partial [Solirubrobacteraceae bacterium]|nr:hypothetical protein [Solirubrobacteraceae bacterium]